MIVTLTPNPSVDRAITVSELQRGEVHRVSGIRIDAGGKGVNVARAVTAQGGDALAVLPVGGPEGHLLEELLDAADVPRRSVDIAGAARMNISVLEPGGTTTKFNEPGPTLSPAECSALLDATVSAASDATWVVGCGSLPPGLPMDLYAQLVRRIHDLGGLVAIDSSGEALAAAVAAVPDLIKPNHEELEELVGRPLPTLADVHRAAVELVSSGIKYVAVSLGGDGALLVTAEETLHARAVISHPLSTVGAGDCMLAGLLHGLTHTLPTAEALCLGVSWGAAAVTLPGSRVPAPEDLRNIRVELTDEPRLESAVGHR
ncbi:MAG: 1-phosphofructokinase [Propionibacteriaceae bacterium]|nr:1-phosphofructokinase [Propionibacteriaceae bacterium]